MAHAETPNEKAQHGGSQPPGDARASANGPRANAEEIVQYLVINTSLAMSPGKIAAQAAHAGVMTALAGVRPLCAGDVEGARAVALRQWYQTWLARDMKKIVLRGTEAECRALAAQTDLGIIGVIDNGHTEVPAGSLTVVALPPMPRADARALTKRLQLL